MFLGALSDDGGDGDGDGDDTLGDGKLATGYSMAQQLAITRQAVEAAVHLPGTMR